MDKCTFKPRLINNLKNKLILNANSVALTHFNNSFTAKADSGCTSHFLKPEHRKALTSLCDLSDGPAAALPDKTIIKATQSGLLNFDKVS